jgi:hypothetical protein
VSRIDTATDTWLRLLTSRGTNVALRSAVLPLVAVSGGECVAALMQGGFRARLYASEQGTMLERASIQVRVPHANILSPDELVTLLHDAGIAYGDFLDWLSESPTDPGVSPTRVGA